MPITAIDKKTALILIDLQKGIVALPTVHPSADIVKQAAKLAKAFRAKELPVVAVNVAGAAPGRAEQPRRAQYSPDWAELVPEIDLQPSDHRVTKHCWGAFTEPGLAELLKSLGVTQVVIAGIATSIGVESTARSAYELGFNVTLATDAMTDINTDTHHNSVTRIFPRLGETGTTDEIIAILDK